MESGPETGRRDFLKKTAAGIVGAAIAPSFFDTGRAETPAEPKKTRNFVRRTLGKTGLELPVVSMGVMNADNPELVRAALDAGIVYLDTAHYYQRGRNEEMIGEVIKGRPRDSFVIAHQGAGVAPRPQDGALHEPEATAGPFIEKFETSLKRLGLDHVEILYLHNVVAKGGALHEPYLTAVRRCSRNRGRPVSSASPRTRTSPR